MPFVTIFINLSMTVLVPLIIGQVECTIIDCHAEVFFVWYSFVLGEWGGDCFTSYQVYSHTDIYTKNKIYTVM